MPELENRYLRVILLPDGQTVHNALLIAGSSMKVKNFDDSDTLDFALRTDAVAASRDLDENTILDVDAEGNVCGITFEHASQRTDVQRLSVEGVAA